MVRRTCVLLLAIVLTASAVAPAAIDVIPRPQQVQEGTGTFTVTADTLVVVAPGADAMTAHRALIDRLAPVGLPLVVVGTSTTRSAAHAAATRIVLTSDGADPALGDEGYVLDVTPAGVTIRASHAAGLFYGVQTLLQLMPPAVYGHDRIAGPVTVPAVHITDAPRFKWRGLLLDVARHFEPKQVVLDTLDQMAVHKLNVFHWHLTDDQGWRLEIKKYPKLTSIGAWRDHGGFGLDDKLSSTFGPGGKYGGFYTQDDVREVLAYAAARHITVVPEVEMPGHASAALRAYPEFGVPAPPSTEVKGDAGIFNGVYEPANEQTFTFLTDVLGEVIDLFPSPWIHIGGDEVPKGPWQNNPPDVAFMKSHGLSGPDQLQSYFVQRIGKYVHSRGRRMIGWDEILEGGLAPDATVMSWRGTEGGKAAAAADHDVVMTPGAFCYLDGEQSANEGAEPHTRGNVLTVQKSYSYEPVPAGLPADQVHHILGVQGNLWTEYVPNVRWAQYLYWPRAAAVAEVGWTPAADRHWDDFARRLPTEQRRLDAMGVNYRPIADDGLAHAIRLAGGNIVIDPVAGTQTRFTMDGNYPVPTSPAYAGPVPLPSGWVQVAARYFRPDAVAAEATAATFLDGRAVTVVATAPKDWDARQTCFYTQRYGGGAGDTVTVTFDAGPEKLDGITVTSGEEATPKTELTQAVLETSTDGKTFTRAATFGPDGTAHADVAGKPVAAFRVRFTALQTPHPIIKTVTLK